jgi:hypothetical protein
VDCWENHSTGPFYELINFFDNEGTLGPVVAAKLAKDFADHRSKAEQVEDVFFVESYREWDKAFQMAAKQGAVEFH